MTTPTSIAVGRSQGARQGVLTTAGPHSLRLTDIVINSDPYGSYKPSRMMELVVDGEPRSALFQLREAQSTLSWQVKPAVTITTKSIISIQTYQAAGILRGRRKFKTVTIRGDAVFRFCLARPAANKHDYERDCAGFQLLLSIVVQRDLKAKDRTRGGPEVGQVVFFGPPTAPNSFKRALDALLELMELISDDQILYATAGGTRDALGVACGFMPTDRVEDDIQYLGEQVCKMLSDMSLRKHSERLASQPQTVASLLKLFENAAVFAADCSSGNGFNGSDSRSNTLRSFDQQLARSKRNFFAGKDIDEEGEPYIRKQDASKLLSVEETRSEVISERESDAHAITSPDEDADLADTLNPVKQSSQLNLRCLHSTRGELLSKIISWFESDTDSNVLWLSGAPGTGKTAIAWSLVAELKNQQRSAGAFFCGPYEYRPYQLWTTLAYKMAMFHPAIKGEIYKTQTENAPDLRNVQVTFEKLIAGPLKALDAQLSSHRPIFLIDGIEQCGWTSTGYQALLDTLPQWLSLPRHCKLIVTSRPQGDIAKVFEGRAITRFSTGDDADPATEDDIHTYLVDRFAKMRKKDESISENWPDSDAVSKLAKHASGLFKWAAIAVDSIESSGDRKKQLTTILEGGTTTEFDSLDDYFLEILDAAIQTESDTFRATIEITALSKEPLTVSDLELFLQDRFPPGSGGVSLEEMCYNLLPIISIDDETKVVRFRHKAYVDYLTDSKRCADRYFIDRTKVHRRMAISCLKIMQQGLKLNICRLESSYHLTSDLQDNLKESLIEKFIPTRLAYASQFWVDHLRGMATMEKRDTEIVNLLRNFLDFHLLYWLEVLSLLSKSDIASRLLLTAAEWLEDIDKDLSLFAADGSRFALTFADVIAKSVPHIYLSALPFSPPSSLVHKRYRDQFPRVIKVIREDDVKWPAMRSSIRTNHTVYSISIHPDGKKVAAGVGRGAVVVSVTTGKTLCQLEGHGSNVRTVAYSPSGKRIATGCDDARVRIFESENGALLFGPFKLHTDWIRSLAWSPDGQRIVTGSDDGKVMVIVAETGNILHEPSQNDWIRTVVFTTEFFISGSDDRTVRIYDAATGTASGEAWTTGQSGYIRAIAISPDNKILAAGSDDTTILLYDMDKRSTINQPLKGHTSTIRSLEFSKNGQLLASGSDDDSVRLWDVQTGKMICDPLYGHTSCVSSVKFSPDMKQLIAGGEDYTIRSFDMDSLPIWGKSLGGTGPTGPIRAAVSLPDGKSVLACDSFGIWKWNLDNGHVENVLFEGHSEHLSNIQSASISRHGTHVATAGRDRAVMIWQANSGRLLCGPLEGHSDDILALSFSTDEKMVASGSEDRKVWVWSSETGQRVCGPMEGHKAGVNGVCFSPDGKQVASGSDDGTAIIWSVESGEKVLGPLEYHHDWIYGVAYSPNGRYLATASDDRSVAIWNVTSGERVFHVLKDHDGYLRCVNWSPDNKKIITAATDDLIRVFDVETGTLVCEPLSGHKSMLTSVAFRGDKPEVLSASLDGTVRVWRLMIRDFMKAKKFTKHQDWVHSVAISPIKDCIASGGDDGQLVVSDVLTGEYNLSFKAHTDWIRCVTYSPDGSKIATCSEDRTINIWNVEDGKLFLGPLSGHDKAVLSVAFSPSGNSLVSGSEDFTVRSWDLSSFVQLNNHTQEQIYRSHNGAVNAVSYARGGSLIISGSADAEIAVWERNDSHRPIRQFGGHEGPILSIRVFDEKIFSSSEDKTIRVWELSTGHALITIYRGLTKSINAIALSPDGQRIVSASDDASIRIFDSNSGEQYTTPLHLSDRILSVAVSHDGTLVACGGADNSVHVWRTDMTRRTVWPDSFMREARGQEFCVVDDQGILEDFNPENGWLRGSAHEAMCWIPIMYRTGLWTPQTLGILGAREIMLDMGSYAHGTKWEQCKAEDFVDKP